MRSHWARRLAKARQITTRAARDDPESVLYGRYRVLRGEGLTLEQCATQLRMTAHSLRKLIVGVLRRSGP